MKNLISLLVLMLPLMGLQIVNPAILSEDGGIVPIIQGKHGVQSLNFETCPVIPKESVTAIISKGKVVIYSANFLGDILIDARDLEPGSYSLELISKSCAATKSFQIY